MKVNELPLDKVVVGLRIKSLISSKLGTVVEIDEKDDRYAQIKWDGKVEPTSGFYGNDCKCEVIDEKLPHPSIP